jgi:hypothetical protein
MQGGSDRRTNSLSLASAISPAAPRYSILQSRDRESNGKRCDVVSVPLSDCTPSLQRVPNTTYMAKVSDSKSGPRKLLLTRACGQNLG